MNTADLRLIRLTLAVIWLVTGFVVLGIYPQHESIALLRRVGLSGFPAVVALYAGALADVAFGILTLSMRGKWLWASQACVVIVYTIIISIWLPEFWIHPFGPILKNLPILLMLWLLYKNEKAA
jgi:hypothetical protein